MFQWLNQHLQAGHIRLLFKTAGCLWVPASACWHPNIHGTSLLPLFSRSTDQNRDQCSNPLIPSTQPTLQKHAASIKTLQWHAPPRPCRLHTQRYICLQSCCLHPLSVKLPLDSPPAPGSSPVCLLSCLPHLNPLHALHHLLSFLFDGKSALETQFACSHYKPCSVSRNPIVEPGAGGFQKNTVQRNLGNCRVQCQWSICE